MLGGGRPVRTLRGCELAKPQRVKDRRHVVTALWQEIRDGDLVGHAHQHQERCETKRPGEVDDQQQGHTDPHQDRVQLRPQGVVAGNRPVLRVGDRGRQEEANNGQYRVGCLAPDTLGPEPPDAERKGDPESEVGPLVEPGPKVRFLAQPPGERTIQGVGYESENE